MNNSYLKNFSREEISDILKTIQTCVKKDNYVISRNDNRKENIGFFDKYSLTAAKIKAIILNIEIYDFCYGLHNEHAGFEHEILYVFCPQIELSYGDIVDMIDIYSKFNIIDGERVVVISFHKRNYPINYLFKQTDDEVNNQNCEEDAL